MTFVYSARKDQVTPQDDPSFTLRAAECRCQSCNRPFHVVLVGQVHVPYCRCALCSIQALPELHSRRKEENIREGREEEEMWKPPRHYNLNGNGQKA